MLLFTLSETIAFSTVTSELTTIQFITLDSSLESIQDFSLVISGNPVKFTQTESKFLFQAEKNALALRELSEFFEKQPTIKVTKVPENTEIDVKVYIKKLLFDYSTELVEVVINYETESKNFIQFTFPASFSASEGQFLMFGQDFYNPKTGTNVVRVTCRDFVQINPAPCSSKMKALVGYKSVSFISHGNEGFQFEKVFFLGDKVSITSQFAPIDDKIKFTVMQIIMMVLMVAIVVMAVVLPIVCCKMNGRKSAGNKAVQCGFGPMRAGRVQNVIREQEGLIFQKSTRNVSRVDESLIYANV